MQKNQLYYGDNRSVLREHIKDESVDLIYLDPPFNSRQDYNVLFAETDDTRSSSQIMAFEDTWEWNMDRSCLRGNCRAGRPRLASYCFVTATDAVECTRVPPGKGADFLSEFEIVDGARSANDMLTKIRAKNFKSLKDVTLDLGARNVLVGANMAGKSNVIDLFRFVHDMAFPNQPGSWALTNAVFARGGFDEILWKGGNGNVILIGLSGRDVSDGIEWFWDYEITIQGGMPGGNFRATSEELHTRKGENATTAATYPLIRTEGFNRYFRDVSGRDLGQTSDQPRSILEFEIPGWPGNFLRSAIARWRFYELVPSLMRTPNQTSAATFLQEHGENLSQWLLNLQAEHYDNSFARIQQVLRDALPQVTGLFNSPTQQSTVALGSREKHRTRPVTLSQMSAGELAFIAFLSLIYSPPDRAGSLYCIEDLENYLHPTLIETLLQVLRQSQEEWERKHEAPQIIMTTHSPLVVDKMKLDEIVFVEKREGATVCSRPSDKPHLRKLLQDEEIGLGDLVYTGALGDVSK